MRGRMFKNQSCGGGGNEIEGKKSHKKGEGETAGTTTTASTAADGDRWGQRTQNTDNATHHGFVVFPGPHELLAFHQVFVGVGREQHPPATHRRRGEAGGGAAVTTAANAGGLPLAPGDGGVPGGRVERVRVRGGAGPLRPD